MDFAIQVVGAGRNGQDRAGATHLQGGLLLVLADGAGGTSGGASAAEVVLTRAQAFDFGSPSDCARFLRAIDSHLTEVGQTTGVVIVIVDGQVFGASVGDSCAWLIHRDGVVDLTQHQIRKPLLGSGDAVPIEFGPTALEGRVLIGTDGLFNYVLPARIVEIARALPLTEVPSALVEAARLPSGALQDDVAIVVAG